MLYVLIEAERAQIEKLQKENELITLESGIISEDNEGWGTKQPDINVLGQCFSKQPVCSVSQPLVQIQSGPCGIHRRSMSLVCMVGLYVFTKRTFIILHHRNAVVSRGGNGPAVVLPIVGFLFLKGNTLGLGQNN